MTRSTLRLSPAKAFYRRTYDRELTETQVAQVRLGAELRSAPAAAVRQVPQSVQEIVAAVNRTNPVTPWYWMPARQPGAGVAMRLNNEWAPGSDPAIASATEAAEAQKMADAEIAYTAWRTGPGKSIGPPT